MPSKMLELIRQNAVPAAILRNASKGALSLPAGEMLEVLVALAPHPEVGAQARATLASWDASALSAALADPATPAEVRKYLGHSAASSSQAQGMDAAGSASGDEVATVSQFVAEHATEIAADENKPFELTGAPETEKDPEPEPEPENEERLSVLQKISRMKVGERVKLAMLGSKDERFILIRDGSKVVQNAVIASPKLSEQEVETFASMKNVQENVLRQIARNRKFMKSYIVVKNLVNNPRCPLDLSLAIMKSLLVPDLKSLSQNKNVAETIRKLAKKQHDQKSAPPGQRRE